ncbi:MAG TPA: tannase/feruloyl esterase family alpha/beta hydrolase, partial [Steroidobacteraceae bacterium]|nr:tannase/feruloyl esterase family alpha/beta hydrolase [Steroidobacteraceae bacterium]
MKFNTREFRSRAAGRLLGAALLSPMLALAAPVSKSVAAQDSCAALLRNNSIVTRSGLEAGAGGGGQACVVHGEIISSPTSTIRFRVDLPEPEHWNTKLMMVGGGGFDGIVPTDAPNGAGLWSAKILGPDAARLAGYALVSSDSGHEGRG